MCKEQLLTAAILLTRSILLTSTSEISRGRVRKIDTDLFYVAQFGASGERESRSESGTKEISQLTGRQRTVSFILLILFISTFSLRCTEEDPCFPRSGTFFIMVLPIEMNGSPILYFISKPFLY